jgi:hypothetical protein
MRLPPGRRFELSLRLKNKIASNSNKYSSSIPKEKPGYIYKLVALVSGCLASSYAKLANEIGDGESTRFIKNNWGECLSINIIKSGLEQIARFSHVN